MGGFLLIDKPAGMTSHDVIDRLRRITGIRKIGHAGTLDPFATGLLIVAIERSATKRLGELLKLDKTYEAVAVLGATSDTQDHTGTITEIPDVAAPDENAVRKALADHTGDLLQIPPMYSAKKINGKKLYALARKGEEVPREPVPVTIQALTLDRYLFPELAFTVSCSSGTYIRTLAHDIGHALNTGAYLKELRRTRISGYDIKDAWTLDTLTPDTWEDRLISEDRFFVS